MASLNRKKKYYLSKLLPVTLPLTKVSLENSLLGQLCHWTKVQKQKQKIDYKGLFMANKKLRLSLSRKKDFLGQKLGKN
jgi:hypothetical protein